MITEQNRNETHSQSYTKNCVKEQRPRDNRRQTQSMQLYYDGVETASVTVSAAIPTGSVIVDCSAMSTGGSGLASASLTGCTTTDCDDVVCTVSLAIGENTGTSTSTWITSAVSCAVRSRSDTIVPSCCSGPVCSGVASKSACKHELPCPHQTTITAPE
jgi:hypothetical protein